MLEAQQLLKRYGSTLAVDHLDLRVAPGEIYALLGANGAGKTTTIHLFLGFLTPDSGRALVGGHDVTADPLAARRRVAFIPEQVSLYPSLSGVENLAYFSTLGGHRQSREELFSLLARVGLSRHQATARVRTYSKGMRQKVGIAIALAKQAEALLLDEPTSGLDPAAANEFSQLLLGLVGEGMAVLMATHDLFRAKEVAYRVGILRQGRLVRELVTSAVSHAELERIYLEHVSEQPLAAVAGEMHAQEAAR
jgi:ABC-2 type transport system ATP-binding protein